MKTVIIMTDDDGREVELEYDQDWKDIGIVWEKLAMASEEISSFDKFIDACIRVSDRWPHVTVN